MALVLALVLAAQAAVPAAGDAAPAAPSQAPERFPFPPEQEPAAEAIWQALRSGKTSPQTLEAARQLVRALPQNPRAYRLLGTVAAMQNQREEALTALNRSLELGIDGGRRAEVLALRARLRLQKDFLGQAREDAEAALALEPDHPGALFVATLAALRAGDLSVARDRALRLTKVAPDMAVGHALLAFALAQDDPDAALEEVRRARALGYPEGSDLRSVEEVAGRVRLIRLAWQLPLALAAVLALGLLILFVAGTLLSRAQVAHLASVTAHLERGEQTPRERLVLRLYAAVLWFGTVFFYVSVPAMVLISLATGLWALYAVVTWMSAVPLKLLLLLILLALGGAWAVLRSLFLRARTDDGGLRLAEQDEARLFAALREVAEVAQARMVDRVHLEPDATVAVREAGGALRVLSGRGERVLHLGFQAVQSLSASELKAVLAHEYGHFSHGDTRLTPVLSRIQETLGNMFVRMASLGNVSLANPVFWYLRLYLRLFASITAGHSRRRELLADRAAALAYGGETFGRALQGVIAAGDSFDRHAARTLVLLRRMGRPCTDVYRCVAAAKETESARLREKRLADHLSQAASEFDSHPPPNDRISRVAGVAGVRPADPAPAATLFADAQATARTLTETLCSRIEQGLTAQEELPRLDREMDPAAQALFAAGFAQHVDALELQEAGDAEGDGLLVASVERLSAALGPDEMLLVPALQTLARTQQRLGRGSEAQASVQRAQAILAAQPNKHEAEEKELAALLEQLRDPGTPSAGQRAQPQRVTP